MNILAWPFLVGRNKNLTHQTIVSPHFLNEQEMSILLAEAAGGPENGPDDAYYREINSKGNTDLSLIFRVMRAKARDYGLGANEYLKDKVGRPILMIEGIVVPGHIGSLKDGGVISEALQIAHTRVEGVYRDFWNEDYTFPAQSSFPFELPTGGYAGRPVELRVQEPLKLSIRLPEPVATTSTASPSKSALTHEPSITGFRPIKIRAFLLIILCALLLIAGGIATYLILHPSVPSQLTQTVQSFCDGLQNSNYTEAINQLKKGSGVPVPTQTTFTNSFSKSGAHHVTCASKIDSPSGTTNNTTLLLTHANKSQEQLSLELIEDSGGSWKIDKITCTANNTDPFC